jgi:hypothetical protein
MMKYFLPDSNKQKSALQVKIVNVSVGVAPPGRLCCKTPHAEFVAAS